MSEEIVINESKVQKSSFFKSIMSIASLVVGIVGLGLFFSPIPEISCGVGGLILSWIGKDQYANKFMKNVRNFGNYFAWINIIWVLLEYGLKFAGIDLFNAE